MPTATLRAQLHDKATRGTPLSADEQAELDAWYAEHDRTESHLLGLTGASQSPADLYARVERASNQLLKTTQQIQELTAQNNGCCKFSSDAVVVATGCRGDACVVPTALHHWKIYSKESFRHLGPTTLPNPLALRRQEIACSAIQAPPPNPFRR